MKTLNNIRQFVILSTLATAFVACDKEELPELGIEAEMNLAYEDLTFTVPASSLTGDIQVQLDVDPQELEDLIVSNGYTMDQLKEVRLTAAHLELIDGNGTFDALGQVQLRMFAAGGMEQLIAQVSYVPDNAISLDLETGGENIMEFFQLDDASIAVFGQVNEAVQEDMEVKASIAFRIVVSTSS
ncbi:MAG: hypothetical protein KDB88_09880 [Flavobacteriales bacterium]|nr:hypothetical protein [Flavobacteriales bacterium]